MKLAELRKTAVAGVALLGQAAAAGLLHGTALTVAELVLSAAAAAGVYYVPNKKSAAAK